MPPVQKPNRSALHRQKETNRAEEAYYKKKQLQGIAVILMVIVYGSKPLLHLNASPDAVFILLGIGGMVWMYLMSAGDSDGN